MSFSMPVSPRDPITTSTSQSAGQSIPREANTDKSQSQDFMTLLITQLQNQNPMEPMESNELVSQLTAMSSVSELKNIRTGIEKLQQRIDDTQLLHTSTLIGRTLSFDANQFTISGDSKPLKLSFNSAGKDQPITFRLYGQDGEPLAQAYYHSKSSEPAGKPIIRSLYDLFGSLLPGQYGIEAVAGADTSIPVNLMSQVNSIATAPGEPPILVMESIAPTTLASVQQISGNR